MIVTRNDRVLVQGITGRQGSFWTERMLQCGTQIVAGVSPGKGGRTVAGVPVFDSVALAMEAKAPSVSVLFTPPLATKEAALSALEAGIERLVVLAEHVPYHDTMAVLAEARERKAQVLGPNTAGLVVPGEAAVGIMPGFAANIFRPGSIGVVSRSGSLGTLFCLNLVQGGFGESAFIGIGGDPILGTTTAEAVAILRDDPRTGAIVIVGEVGGTLEEDAAEVIRDIDKPVVAFVAGRTAPPGKRMGHAGAIVTGSKGSGSSKVSALSAAGAAVIDTPSEVAPVLRKLLGRTDPRAQKELQ